MAKTGVTVRVTATTTLVLSFSDYEDQWHEKCEEDAEDGDYPPITEEFVLEMFQAEVDSGDADLAEIFESAPVEITQV